MFDDVPQSWCDVLQPVLAAKDARRLSGWLRAQEEGGEVIYPPRGCRLRALELTPLDAVRVVILGQDPYHGPGQAHGLCFSVPKASRRRLRSRTSSRRWRAIWALRGPQHGNLESWARQGVLLLNNTLTVSQGQAGSHAGKGWEAITDACVAAVAARAEPTVFILWGSHAQGKAARIPELREASQHLLLKSPHPSPLSAYRGFLRLPAVFAGQCLSGKHGRGTIDWRL